MEKVHIQRHIQEGTHKKGTDIKMYWEREPYTEIYTEEKTYPKQNERNVGGQRSSNHKIFVTAVKYVDF